MVRKIALAREVANRIEADPLASLPWNAKQWEFASSLVRFLMMIGPNQIGGKTTILLALIVWHLTGRYPKHYTGTRFKEPPTLIAGTVKKDKCQEIFVDRLFGPIFDRGGGTGRHKAYISTQFYDPSPSSQDLIIARSQSRGAIQTAFVDWHDEYGVKRGKSQISFISYEGGWERTMSSTVDGVFLSEEPPKKVYNELKARLQKTRGYFRLETCPQKGESEVIDEFRKNDSGLFQLINYSVDDCTHLSAEHREEARLVFLNDPEAAFRVYGDPLKGEGYIFSHILNESIQLEAFAIPKHWPQIIGIDFPHTSGEFAVVRCAIDPQLEIFYVTHAFKARINSSNDRMRILKNMGGEEIPVAWPHDGGRDEPEARGHSLSTWLLENGCAMLDDSAHYEDQNGKKDQRTMPVVNEIAEAMVEGRFKIFFNAGGAWCAEKDNFHIKDGRPAKGIKKDIIDATVKAFMMRRYAKSLDQIRESEYASQEPSESFFGGW